jgi:hypothetical protein
VRALCAKALIAEGLFPAALETLTKRNLITTRTGSNHRQSTYKVNWFDTICASFSDAQNQPDDHKIRCTEPHFLMHSASNSDAPITENTALTRAATASDLDVASLRLIDLLFFRKPQNLEKSLINTYRGYLHKIMQFFGEDENRQRYSSQYAAPQPKDDEVTAFLNVADLPRLNKLLEDLFGECQERRHNPQKYIWFTVIALQRIQGISVKKQHNARGQSPRLQEKAPAPRWRPAVSRGSEVKTTASTVTCTDKSNAPIEVRA